MAIFTQDAADQMDRENSISQRWVEGTELKILGTYSPVILTIAITTDATGNLDTVAPFAFELLDVVVQCRAANGSGSVTVKKTAAVITDAIAMATNNAIARAGTIDKTNSTFAAGDTIRLTANGANDRGLITIIGKRSA